MSLGRLLKGRDGRNNRWEIFLLRQKEMKGSSGDDDTDTTKGWKRHLEAEDAAYPSIEKKKSNLGRKKA